MMLSQIDEPLEFINDIQVAMLDDVERQLYKQKLIVEIAHFRQREQLYAQKREQLLELELEYRRNQKRVVKYQENNEDEDQTQNLLVEGLRDKIKESRRKIDLQESAIEDLNEKMDEIKDTTRQRQEEIAEMKRQVEIQASKGQRLQ